MFNKTSKRKVQKQWLKEKKQELYRYEIAAEYMKHRIEEEGEKKRRQDLSQLQTLMEELKRQIEFAENL